MSGGPLERWRARGRRVEVFGHRLFSVEAGPRDAPPLLLLHGFPSASIDFHRVIDRLAREHRVIAHDHLGFGLSDKPAGHSYSLFEQAELALGLWRRLGVSGGHLVGHDYGTSVATEILARRERGFAALELTGVTLANGSVLLELARLRPSQRIARSRWTGPLFGRLVGRGTFHRAMRRLWGDPARCRVEDLDAIWAALRTGDGHLRVHALSSYLDERVRFRDRWVGALERLDLPLHLLWGRRDPVAVPAIAEALATVAPTARLTWLDELGHYPMLEDPEAWAEALAAGLTAGRGGALAAGETPPSGS